MSYAAPLIATLPPVYLSSLSRASVGRFNISTPSSAAWTLANRIVYVPFTLSHPVTVYKYFWLNGSTVGTNNLQVGVYDTAFARINAGTSTLSAGGSICQYDNITDYALGPGRYYMALWCNGTTATVYQIGAATSIGATGVYHETNASGIVATGTPVSVASTTPNVPTFGLVLRSSP